MRIGRLDELHTATRLLLVLPGFDSRDQHTFESGDQCIRRHRGQCLRKRPIVPEGACAEP